MKNLRKKKSVWDLILIKGPCALFFLQTCPIIELKTQIFYERK